MAIIFTGSKAITKICSEIKSDLFAQSSAEEEGVVCWATWLVCTDMPVVGFCVCQNDSRVANHRWWLDVCAEEDTVSSICPSQVN